MLFSSTVSRALEVAATAHQQHYRKNPADQIPYISHPAMVGYLLQKAGYGESVVAAGILHDVLEDTDYPRESLVCEFGERIVEWVEWITERDKSLPWEQRKKRYLDRLAQAPAEAIAIVTADKIHNLNGILAAVERGEDIWAQFTADRKATLAHMRRTFAVLSSHGETPLLAELRELLERVSET